MTMLSAAVALLTEGGKSSKVISLPEHMTTALSMQLRSSRMFPGQSYL